MSDTGPECDACHAGARPLLLWGDWYMCWKCFDLMRKDFEENEKDEETMTDDDKMSVHKKEIEDSEREWAEMVAADPSLDTSGNVDKIVEIKPPVPVSDNALEAYASGMWAFLTKEECGRLSSADVQSMAFELLQLRRANVVRVKDPT